jgi:HAD superfamily hydrolase (TIGR01509 family)
MEGRVLGRGMIKGVLFDFDGTLTRPGALDFPAIKREIGCPADQPILEYLETQPDRRRTKLMRILEEKEEIAAGVSHPNRGAVKCLCALKNQGILLGIFTRNSLRSVEKVLQKFQGVTIRDFAAVITRDVSLPKPHPDSVCHAARQMELLPSELLVVGDFRFDVMAGNAAGSRTVLLTNGWRSVMDPGDPAPDHIITQLDEMLDIVEQYGDKESSSLPM